MKKLGPNYASTLSRMLNRDVRTLTATQNTSRGVIVVMMPDQVNMITDYLRRKGFVYEVLPGIPRQPNRVLVTGKA